MADKDSARSPLTSRLNSSLNTPAAAHRTCMFPTMASSVYAELKNVFAARTGRVDVSTVLLHPPHIMDARTHSKVVEELLLHLDDELVVCLALL